MKMAKCVILFLLFYGLSSLSAQKRITVVVEPEFANADNFISTQAAAQQYAQKLQGQSLIIFPEARERPIKWDDSLRSNWLESNYVIKPYVFHAQPGEYFVFQVGA